VYGPYADIIPFSEELVNACAMSDPLTLVGDDLNFTLSLREVWGENPWVDAQSSFFLSFMEKHHLVDIELVKLVPIWHNFRIDKDVVSKGWTVSWLLKLSCRLSFS